MRKIIFCVALLTAADIVKPASRWKRITNRMFKGAISGAMGWVMFELFLNNGQKDIIKGACGVGILGGIGGLLVGSVLEESNEIIPEVSKNSSNRWKRMIGTVLYNTGGAALSVFFSLALDEVLSFALDKHTASLNEKIFIGRVGGIGGLVVGSIIAVKNEMELNCCGPEVD
jgi:hypothetical protein